MLPDPRFHFFQMSMTARRRLLGQLKRYSAISEFIDVRWHINLKVLKNDQRRATPFVEKNLEEC
jgi:hypothetical protein